MSTTGKWTIDRLLEYTKFNDDLDGDGRLHTGHDFFGYVGDSTGSGLSAGAFVVAGSVDLLHNLHGSVAHKINRYLITVIRAEIDTARHDERARGKSASRAVSDIPEEIMPRMKSPVTVEVVVKFRVLKKPVDSPFSSR